MNRVLIVEDDGLLGRALATGLREAGFEADTAGSVAEARTQLTRLPPDLVVLDLALPDQDGLALLDTLQAVGHKIPVIITTARGLLAHRIEGLQRGADDYLVKPFALAELLARIQAVLRRTAEQETRISWGGLTADLNRQSVQYGNELLNLTPREFLLLVYLIRRQGQPASRDMLAREVWQIRARATPLDNVIDVTVSRLRRKLADLPGAPPLCTVRGLGYQLGEAP